MRKKTLWGLAAVGAVGYLLYQQQQAKAHAAAQAAIAAAAATKSPTMSGFGRYR